MRSSGFWILDSGFWIGRCRAGVLSEAACGFSIENRESRIENSLSVFSASVRVIVIGVPGAYFSAFVTKLLMMVRILGSSPM